MHKPYRELTQREPDFLVQYRLYKPHEGGRPRLPSWGLSCDFWYPHSGHNRPNMAFIIWPKFLDANGNTILDNSNPVLAEGLAEMCIFDREKLAYHRGKIEIGITGYFIEAGPIAVCTVIKLMGELSA